MWFSFVLTNKTISARPGYPCVVDKIVVLDSHALGDNRISKHVGSVQSKYPVLRVSFNFYQDRCGENNSYGMTRVHNTVTYKNPYLNGMVFNLRTMLGFGVGRMEEFLRSEFVADGDRLVFHVHDPYVLGMASKLKKRFPGSSILYDRHEYYEAWDYGIGISIPHIFEKLFGKRVDELVFVTNNIEEMLKMFKGKRVTVVPNYPHGSNFSKEVVLDKADMLSEGQDLIFLYVGTLNLDFDRDTRLMFSLMEELMRADKRIHFVLAGRTYGKEMLQTIEDLTKKFPERVDYLGELPMDEVIKQTQKAHFGFLLMRPDSPVWSDSHPLSANKVYEYMMGGAIPIIRAVIEDRESIDECSLIFGKESDLGTMQFAITELVNDRQKMRTMMLSCHDIGSKFSWENVSVRYLECYYRLFGRKVEQ